MEAMPGRILSQFENCLDGRDILVCGDGPSFHKNTSRVKDYQCIAVNRACSKLNGQFALCIENEGDGSWESVWSMRPIAIFTFNENRGVRIPGRWNDLFDVPFGPRGSVAIRGCMSAWYATAVAMYMGAETIGIIGVDIHGHRSFDKSEKNVRRINTQWSNLIPIAEKRGQTLLNLSDHSKLDAIPTGSWDQVRKI